MADYSIWALEHAFLPTYPDPLLLYGKPDGTRALSFYYFVIQDEDRVLMVDAGFSDNEFCAASSESYGMERFAPPARILPRIGLTPEDVDAIIVSHHHWDHISGLGYFPNATVYIQEREVVNWHAKVDAPERLCWLHNGLDPQTGTDLERIDAEGRLRLVNGDDEPFPGVRVRPAFDTHTAGSQYVIVTASDGGDDWVFTGDTAYVYDNIGGIEGTEAHIPVGWAQGSQERCVRSTDEMLSAAGDNIVRVLPSHEDRLWSRYPSVTFPDGNRVAEISLAPGVSSRLPAEAR
ncbi:N-acyl homoserine lactonase family protein [Microbacterium sp. X-17]|uniref:N-acyl homoserine lactonase family protein n=1 Tax=Microbacterium sp. X-17 TaxID=3144404 RepID=UPI0031F4F293